MDTVTARGTGIASSLAKTARGNGIRRMNLMTDNLSGIGAVLTWMDSGTKRPCGQTVGADGRGYFCVIFIGDPDIAWTAAIDYCKGLEGFERGRISEVHLIPMIEGFHGFHIRVKVLPE